MRRRLPAFAWLGLVFGLFVALSPRWTAFLFARLPWRTADLVLSLSLPAAVGLALFGHGVLMRRGRAQVAGWRRFMPCAHALLSAICAWGAERVDLHFARRSALALEETTGRSVWMPASDLPVDWPQESVCCERFLFEVPVVAEPSSVEDRFRYAEPILPDPQKVRLRYGEELYAMFTVFRLGNSFELFECAARLDRETIRSARTRFSLTACLEALILGGLLREDAFLWTRTAAGGMVVLCGQKQEGELRIGKIHVFDATGKEQGMLLCRRPQLSPDKATALGRSIRTLTDPAR